MFGWWWDDSGAQNAVRSWQRLGSGKRLLHLRPPCAALPGLRAGQYRASLFPTGTPMGTGWLLSLLELSALCPGVLCWAHSLEMEWGSGGRLSFGTRATVLAPVMPSRPPACQERSAQPWAPDLTDEEGSVSSFWESSQTAEQHNARPFVPHLLVLRMLEGKAGPQLCAGWTRFQEGLMHVSERCVHTLPSRRKILLERYK